MFLCFKPISTAFRGCIKIFKIFINRVKVQGMCFACQDRLLPTFSPFHGFNLLVILCWLQQQLQALLETLSATEPHYIRCIKPNNLLKPAIFENKSVLQQLRCGVSSTPKPPPGDCFLKTLYCSCYILWYALVRELWRQLGLAVLGIQRGDHFMSSLIDLVFLLLMFCLEGMFYMNM